MALFWVIAAIVAFVCLWLIFLPLLRGRDSGARRASYDMQVYRDQLSEVDRELARGVLSGGEAEAVRVEISRRLLAAADAEEAEAASAQAPRGVSRIAALVGIVLVPLGALGLYLAIGAPGQSDQPYALREQRRAEAHAARPRQAEAEVAAEARRAEAGIRPQEVSEEDLALIGQLRQLLEERPDDADGYRLLAGSLGSIGRFVEAREAQERVVEILGDGVSARDLVNLAELRILAAGGYVSPEAEEALIAALERDPRDPLGRYYSGLVMAQAGKMDIAYGLWAGLLQEGPPDAPWMAPIRAEIGEIARLAGRPVPEIPGPDQAMMDAAADMTPQERAEMIEGMVTQLSGRLASEGGPPEDWARLIRSLAVLGRGDEAAEVLAQAREAFAGDAGALGVIEAEAAGLAPDNELRGPTAGEIEAASEMSAGDRAAMVEGMVAQLGERLASEGGPPQDWARMITSLSVLGRQEQARAILQEARTDFASDPAALAVIDAAARQAGLAE